MRILPFLAAAVLLLAGFSGSSTLEPVELASFTLESEGSVLLKQIPVEKADPLYDDEGNPERQLRGLRVRMPIAAYGKWTPANPFALPGVRVIEYAVSGYKIFSPTERNRWKRDNGTTEFDPSRSPFSDLPAANVHAYSQGLWNGYGDAFGSALGPESFVNLLPGEVDVREAIGQAFTVVTITDREILAAMTLEPDEPIGTTVTWSYKRTFDYGTSTPSNSLAGVLPYIPIDFESGTYHEDTSGPESATITALWSEIP